MLFIKVLYYNSNINLHSILEKNDFKEESDNDKKSNNNDKLEVMCCKRETKNLKIIFVTIFYSFEKKNYY